MTLEAIGKKYKITRERVRQIENYSIINIRKSKEYAKEKAVLMSYKENRRTRSSYFRGISSKTFIKRQINTEPHTLFTSCWRRFY
jgi:hypothetical protein